MTVRLLVAVALVAASIAVAAPLPVAHAGSTTTCRSADLRYPFEPGGPRTFGVFRLKVTAGSCTTARRVARRWMQRFEAELDRGRVRLPRSVDGFAFTQLPPNAAQTYRLRGRRGATTIRFDYVVPNG